MLSMCCAGKDYTGPLPKDIIKKGILVKAGGKDGSKSQNKRTFALGELCCKQPRLDVARGRCRLQHR